MQVSLKTQMEAKYLYNNTLTSPSWPWRPSPLRYRALYFTCQFTTLSPCWYRWGKHTLEETVLALLALLSGGALSLGGEADSDLPVGGLELLEGVDRVVDEGESSRSATTKRGPESKRRHDLLVDRVHGRKLLGHLGLGGVGRRRVEHVHHHLLALQQSVRQEATRSDRHCTLVNL